VIRTRKSSGIRKQPVPLQVVDAFFWLVTDKGLEWIGIDLPCDVWLCG